MNCEKKLHHRDSMAARLSGASHFPGQQCAFAGKTIVSVAVLRRLMLHVYHPRHAEFVYQHAEAVGPEGFLERHRDVAALRQGVKATLNKYRRRHDAWKARRVCCVAQGRLAVLPSHAAQPAGLPDITPSL
ncbi:hypothetical protein [Dyella sp.]|uniref:hypothetical protein n=1 Tax=Dyella sp. TaxID=1869338 RepID=UPI002FD9085C